MIIIINKVKIHGKRFCEKFVTGSNLRGEGGGLVPSPRRERVKGTYRRPGMRSATRQDLKA
jgi:hypothetical protein